MSIDFTGATAISIPEGNVVRITRKLDGSLIWEKPSGYTWLEYIESDGTQWIDTNYRVSSDKLKIKASFLITEIQPWHALWGCEETNSGPWSLTPLMNNGSAVTFYNGYSSQIGSIPIAADTVYSLECYSLDGFLGYKCGDASLEVSVNGSLCKSDSIYVFSLNSAKDDGVLNQASKMRLFDFKIYDNGVLVRDFVPCINPSGEAGLYDKAHNVFYGNAGTGLFATG